MNEKPKEKRSFYAQAPWYLHLLWFLLGISTLLFVFASLGFGGVKYGYISFRPTSNGGCEVILAVFDAMPPEDVTRGCVQSSFSECQIAFGALCKRMQID